jgi:MFS family permease
MKNVKGLFSKHGNMTVMVLLVIMVGMGEKMAERFLPLYLIALGGSTWSVGLLNAMDNLLGALYSFPGGFIADRIGYKKSLQIFTGIAIFGYALVILIPTWQAVLVGAVFFIAWTAVSLPAIMNLVAKTVPKNKRSFGVSIHSFFRRIPMALGPMLGGVIIGIYGRVLGIKIAFGVAIVLGLLAMVMIQKFMVDDFDKTKTVKKVNIRDSLSLLTPQLRTLLASDILIRFAEQIPYAFVVIWVVDNQGLTTVEFGLLTMIEMVTAMLVYIPVAMLADHYGKKPFVLITFGFFTIFPLMLLISKGFWMFVIAFIIRGLKEFGEPTRKALIMDLAPEDYKASAFGTYYLIRDIVVSIAALSSALLWNIAPEVNFLVAFAFGVLGTTLFAVYGKDLKGH